MPEYRDQVLGESFGPDNRTDSVLSFNMSASGARALLLWSRQQTEGYHNVNVYNMTSSWRDGLAFCAIIHRYRPDLIDFDKLSKDNIVQNNELAFDICERLLDNPSILDVPNMVENPVDKLSVLTFVSQLFNYFKDKIPANQVVCTKMNAPIKSKSELSLAGKGKRASNQIYSLQGKAKRFSSALKNVFKSDAKEDRLKVEDSLTKQSSNENLKLVPDIERKSDTSTTLPARQPNIGTTCFVCHSKVFILERLVVEHKLFHRACFKCSKCSSGLRPGTYTYCSDTETFSCIYECMGAFKKTQEEIRIKLRPITDKVFDVLDKSSQTTSCSHSRKSSGTQSSLGPPFSIIKKNAISIGSLQKSFEDVSSLKSKQRRHSKERIQSKSKDPPGITDANSTKTQGDTTSTPTSGTTKIEVEVKHENGKVKSCVRIHPMKTKQSLVQSNEVKNGQSNGQETSKVSSWKEKVKGPVGLNDAYNRDEDEKPQEGSVNKLRMKFMNIDNIIEDKHRQKVAKKNERIQREIKRVVPTWNEGTTVEDTTEKNIPSNDTKKDLESESSGSLATSSGQSSSSQIDNHSNRINNNPSKSNENKIEKYSGQNRVVVSVSRSQITNTNTRKNSNKDTNKTSNLAVPIEESSSSSSCSTPSPTNRTMPIPIIVKPSIDSDNERERSCSQTSSTGILSPLSDSPFPESPSSPITSTTEDHWSSSQNSLAEANTNTLPKMSIIIAQEAASTKINSRYFTVETCESKDRNVIVEKKDEETVDIEGEFRFGDDKGNAHEALLSLNNCSITRERSESFREEEVLLSSLEIMDELNALGTLLSDLEKRGVEMEKLLRQSMTSERPLDNEDELVREWLTLVQEKNVILRRESELIYLIKFHQYEDRYLLVECELRALLSLKDEQKTIENIKRERELMAELFSLVQRRTSIVDKLEEDRLRERHEEETIKHVVEDGIRESAEGPWAQKQQDDGTKVAFSRFYC